MFLPTKSAAILTLAAAITLGPSVLAQEPNFDDLANERDLVSVVRSLSRRVAELEARLNALEVKGQGAGVNTMSAPKAPVSDNSQLERVVSDAKGYRDKLQAALDGHHFADPNDPRVVYWKIKKNGEWDTVVTNIKRFVSFMDAVLPRAGELSGTATAAYADLIRWGRGRILYRTGLGMAQQDVLAVEYGAAVIPVPAPPSVSR